MAVQNIALNKTATASSCVAPYTPAKAVDGSIAAFSRWLSQTVPAVLTVDLGAPYLITSWIVKHMSTAGWQSPDYNMCDFKLQGSNDNSSWSDLDVVTNNSLSVTTRNVSLAVLYRYVRLYVSKGLRANPQLASVMEFEVYGNASPYLRSLTVSAAQALPLTPAFTPTAFTYTAANVANSVSGVLVTPVVQDARAAVKVNGAAVTSGAVVPVTLNVGSNAINITVTNADQTMVQPYTVTIIRDGQAANADLSGLTMSAGTLAPTFSAGTTAYTASVGYDQKTITVTPTASSSGAAITVNGVPVASGTASGEINLNEGNTTSINIVVTNGNASKTYTVVVTRASNPYLNSLKVIYPGPRGSITDNIPISQGQTQYSDNVPNTVTSVQIIAAAEDAVANVTINGQNAVSGMITGPITVTPTTGTSISIVVTSNIGSDRRAYGITIN